MSKNLSTKELETVSSPEKDLLDPKIVLPPLTYEWLCGVQDGVNLLKKEVYRFVLREFKDKKFTISDFWFVFNSITDGVLSAVKENIREEFTKVRLLYFSDYLKITTRVFNIEK